ncbi:bifunctional oligoribonuclease/PAP phosphatase NrnA [candidate division TA06 bacterium]|nr:bifunctional oligoribonuclease/PAP phosphatase NrnA [candidate division TA06 bacterium]
MEKGSKRWAKVAQEIQSHKRFLVTTHVNPDGDGIGSGIALMGHLSALGKDAVMVSSDPLPERYRFLDPERHIRTYDPSTSVGLKEEVIFVLDTSELTRLGRVQEVVENRKDQVISIDHHPFRDNFAHIHVVDDNAFATGELIYDLIQSMKGKLTKSIAEALYISILTDTGLFRYGKNPNRIHTIVLDLLKTGIDPGWISEMLFESYLPKRLQLLGAILSQLEMFFGDRVSALVVTQRMMEEFGARQEDLDGVVDYARYVIGVEVGVMFTELEDGRVKVSFRSKRELDVNQLAVRLGGGGHSRASGLVMRGSLKEVKGRVLEEIGVSLPPIQKPTKK